MKNFFSIFQQLRKTRRGILVAMIVVVGGLCFSQTSYAQVMVPPSSGLFEKNSDLNLAETSNIKDYTGSAQDGSDQFRTIIYKLIGFLKKLMGHIAILLLIYGGVRLYLTHGNEESYEKAISQIAGIGTGFLIMLLAVNAVDWVFFGREGGVLRGELDPAEFARRGMAEITGIFDYFTIFAVVIAVAFIVWNTITLIIAGGEDESQISNIKKKIIYSVVGIIILVSVKPMINIITDIDGGLVIPSIFGGISIIARWINFILGLIAILSVIAIIYAGIRLILHFGDEEATTQAKEIIIGAIIGLLISFSAWTIINYFIAPT